MNAALERIEPVLSFAYAAAMKSDWPRVSGSLRACAAFAEVRRPPAYDEFDPGEIGARATRLSGRPVELDIEHARKVTGDIEQIVAIAHAILRGVKVEGDALLRVRVCEIDDVPAWQLVIDGPGRFPDTVDFGFGLTCPFGECESVWTSATRGGRIDSFTGRLDLRLKGVRAIPDVEIGCQSLIGPLREAERRARICASGEFAATETESQVRDLGKLLENIDAQDDPATPCDLAAVVREVLPARPFPGDTPPLEVSVAPDIPASAVRRNRVARMFRTLRELGANVLTHGGSMRLEAAYDSAQRSVTVLFTASGWCENGVAERYLPSLERAAHVHGGAMDADIAQEAIGLLITMPDAIALALDEWLPGWDTFAPRSIQMLRLLKSGGPVPPEDLILGGVLEDELERRLLPRLGVAPAATLVHDLAPRTPALTPSSPQRLEKVLAQIKRGKPKKEICAPAYAAEILWQFSVDMRHAGSVGVSGSGFPNVPDLCKALVGTPVDALRALRLLARVILPPAG